MAEHNWRTLLDDPEVRDVITRAVNGPGRKRYDPRGKDALVFDDLECYLYDRAVAIAMEFPDDVPPPGDPERRRWYSYLWTALNTAIPWLWVEYAGQRGSTKREVWHAGIRSVDVLTATHHAGEAPPIEVMHADPYWWHRITAADPLGVVLRIERLEAMLRDAEYKSRHGAYVTETHPDVLCIEPLCRELAHTAGRCRRHYREHFERWGRQDGTSPLCAAHDCPLVATSRGYCSRHYEAEHTRRQRENDPWPDVEPGPCAEPGCDRMEAVKGRCKHHYALIREAQAPQCSEPGCDRNAFARSLCRMHYKRHARANGAPCATDGCDRVAECKGLCNTCYERHRQAAKR